MQMPTVVYCVLNTIYRGAFVLSYRVKDMVGFDASEMVGQKLTNFFHPKACSNPEHRIRHNQCMNLFNNSLFIYLFVDQQNLQC